MPKQQTTAFVFRGTTLGWPGNAAQQHLPRTPTTTNPMIALLFAISCNRKGPQPVVYIAKQSSIKRFDISKNLLAKTEDEKAYGIKPSRFPAYCEGYVTLQEAVDICRVLELPVPAYMGDALFDKTLGEIMPLDTATIKKFVALARPLLKKSKFDEHE